MEWPTRTSGLNVPSTAACQVDLAPFVDGQYVLNFFFWSDFLLLDFLVLLSLLYQCLDFSSNQILKAGLKLEFLDHFECDSTRCIFLHIEGKSSYIAPSVGEMHTYLDIAFVLVYKYGLAELVGILLLI